MVLMFFLLSIITVIYIYVGYHYILRGLAWLIGTQISHKGNEGGYTPSVTIFFSALNEQDNVLQRIENIVSLDYPGDKVEIIVISDGSTDDTCKLVNCAIAMHSDRNIRLINFEQNRGQAAAQNAVAIAAKYDLLLSTDAETRFPVDLLKKMLAPFSDPNVGVVGAKISYLSEGYGIGEAYNLYRRAEYDVRRCETALGIGFQVDGPCTAYRKGIWEPIKDYEDVDQVITLIARKKGFMTVQAEEAICYDRANATRQREIRQRARMTRKGLLSKLGRWGMKETIRYPFFSWALYSHKILRYFTPLLMCIMLFSGAWLAAVSGYGVEIFSVILSGAILLVIGNLVKIPLLQKLYTGIESFVCANIGFALGIFGWISGNKEGRYKPTGQL